MFLQGGLEFLGHWIDKDGICPLPQNVKETVEAKGSISVIELKKHLGLLNYC